MQLPGQSTGTYGRARGPVRVEAPFPVTGRASLRQALAPRPAGLGGTRQGPGQVSIRVGDGWSQQPAGRAEPPRPAAWTGDNAGVGEQSQRRYLPVDDPRRLLIRRAAFGTLLASAIFVVFTATKLIKPIYVHAPWFNDPYDTMFSFTMFFVPLVAVGLLVEVSLSRRSEPLPIERVVSILRGCRVAVGAIVVEVLSAWIAVALGADRPRWTDGATGLLIAVLVLCTLVTARVIADLVRVPQLRRPQSPDSGQAADWLADLVSVASRESRLLGPLRGPGLTALAWIDRNVMNEVRRHPLLAAAFVSAVFGVAVFAFQGIREGYAMSVTLMAMGLGFCGMFAFLVVAGSYLGVARRTSALHGVQRRAIDASVAACILAITALAFRDYLWWAVGSDPSAARPFQLASLVGGAALSSFVVVFAAETLLRSHHLADR